MEAQKTYVVYAHKNKMNNKMYIGITGNSPEKRWDNGNGYRGQIFFNAIKKYGWDNFEHKILIHNLTLEQANKWEAKLINYYNCLYPNGYNNKGGGGASGCLTSLTKEKLSKIFKGCKNPKISISLKKYYETHDGVMKGKKFSETAKHRMSLAKIGKPSPKKGIPLNAEELRKLRIDNKNCLRIVCVNNMKIYISQTRAGEDLGISNKHIGDVCKGRRPHTHGYYFMYYEDFIAEYPNLVKKLKEDDY